LWVTHSRQVVRAAGQPAWVAGLRDTALFGEPAEQVHTTLVDDIATPDEAGSARPACRLLSTTSRSRRSLVRSA